MAKPNSPDVPGAEFPESDSRHPKWQGHTHTWSPKNPKMGQAIKCSECGMSMTYDPRSFE